MLKLNNIYDPKNTGQRIRAKRDALRLSQDDFLEKYGNKLGIKSRQSLSKWEAGDFKSDFSVWALLELCNIFQCDPGYLLGEYEHETREATDIVAATGLTVDAVNTLVEIKENVFIGGYDEIYKTLSDMIVNPDFMNSLILIHHMRYGSLDRKREPTHGALFEWSSQAVKDEYVYHGARWEIERLFNKAIDKLHDRFIKYLDGGSKNE